MKKFFLTIAVLMLMGFCGKAQNDMFFKWSEIDDETYRDIDNGVNIALPTAHGLDNDNDAEAPLGSGLMILGVLGAGYIMKKKEVR